MSRATVVKLAIVHRQGEAVPCDTTTVPLHERLDLAVAATVNQLQGIKLVMRMGQTCKTFASGCREEQVAAVEEAVRVLERRLRTLNELCFGAQEGGSPYVTACSSGSSKRIQR